MSVTSVVTHIDEILVPVGFTRTGRRWHRSTDQFRDVIGIQASKDHDEVPINAGVLDPEVYTIYIGNPAPELLDETECTVTVRIGDLLTDQRDLWWALDEASICDAVDAAVLQHVLPFIERMHSRTAMAAWLAARGVLRKKYPPPILN